MFCRKLWQKFPVETIFSATPNIASLCEQPIWGFNTSLSGGFIGSAKKLEGQGLYGLEFITTPECVSEVSLILNSEICKKKSIIFKLAVVLNFYKIDLKGVETEVQPVVGSNNVYLNSASTFVSHRILEDSLTTMKSRFDDFIGKGSGKPSNYIDHTKFSIIIDVNGM